jgi:Ca2+-binding EF-hand superfamily protein
MTHSGETLYESMKIYDYEGNTTIETNMMKRVFNRLGLTSIEAHLPSLLQAGGVKPSDEKIDIFEFASNFEKELNRRQKASDSKSLAVVSKVHSLLKTLKISIFDLFVRLDTNQSAGVEKVELKTGLHSLGMVLSREEFELLWKSLHKKSIDLAHGKDDKALYSKVKPASDSVSYGDVINAFVKAGCLKLQKTTDRANVLLTKYRTNLKRLGLSVDRAYKAYDPKDLGFVFRNDFIDISMIMGLNFSQDELAKIFEVVCSVNAKKDTVHTSTSRFS